MTKMTNLINDVSNETDVTDKESEKGGGAASRFTRKWKNSKPVSLSANQARPIKVTEMSKPKSFEATMGEVKSEIDKILSIAKKMLNDQIFTSYVFNQLTKKELQQERFILGERRNVICSNDLFAAEDLDLRTRTSNFISNATKLSYTSTSESFEEDIAAWNERFELDKGRWVDLNLTDGTVVEVCSSYGNMPAIGNSEEVSSTISLKEITGVKAGVKAKAETEVPYALFLGWKKEEIGEGEQKTTVYTQQWLYDEQLFAQNMPSALYRVIKASEEVPSFPWGK